MPFQEGNTIGIDLGTTYSALAQVNDRGASRSPIHNADDKPITPSVVLLGEDGHVLVGPSFERISIEDPSHIVEAIKRQMGNKDFYIVYQNKRLTPEFISALIMKKLKQDCEKRIGPIANAVITVPYYFNDIRRKATQDAGKIAGLNVVDILNEPTAATLAYAWIKGELGRSDLKTKEKTILVYDLGGGTFDVTVVRYTPTNFRVLATDGDVMLGGLDWTQRIVDHVCEQFKRKFAEDPRENPETLRAFTQECEDAKRQLSTRSQVPISLYYKGKTLTVSLDAGRFRADDGRPLAAHQGHERAGAAAGESRSPRARRRHHGGRIDLHARGRTDAQGSLPPRAEPRRHSRRGRRPGGGHPRRHPRSQGDGRPRPPGKSGRRPPPLGEHDRRELALARRADHGSDGSDAQEQLHHDPEEHGHPQRGEPAVRDDDPQPAADSHLRAGRRGRRSRRPARGLPTSRSSGLPAGLPSGSPVDVTYSYDSNGRIQVAAVELTGKRQANIEIIRSQGLDNQGVDAFQQIAQDYHVE